MILSLKYGHWIGTNYIGAMLSKKSRGLVNVVSEYFYRMPWTSSRHLLLSNHVVGAKQYHQEHSQPCPRHRPNDCSAYHVVTLSVTCLFDLFRHTATWNLNVVDVYSCPPQLTSTSLCLYCFHVHELTKSFHFCGVFHTCIARIA